MVDQGRKGVMMLTRVNVHFRGSTLKRLDEIKDKIKNLSSAGIWTYGLTRADLIRYAVAQVFDLEHFYVHAGEATLSEALKKVLKKSGCRKGV